MANQKEENRKTPAAAFEVGARGLGRDRPDAESGRAERRGGDGGDPGAQAAGHVASLYVFRSLDVLIDIAEALSKDYRKNPHRYPEVGAETLRSLSQFHAMGTAPEWLDHGERADLYAAYFGAPDTKEGAKSGRDEFSSDGDKIREAAQKYVERRANESEELLRDNVVQAALRFNESYRARWGNAIAVHVHDVGVLFNTAWRILRDERLAPVFGRVRPNVENPLDRNAALVDLVKEMGRQLKDLLDPGAREAVDKFAALQRVARSGGATIEAVLANTAWENNDDARTNLIRNANAWGSALADARTKS